MIEHGWKPLQFADMDLTDKKCKPWIAKKFAVNDNTGFEFFVGRMTLKTKEGIWIKFPGELEALYLYEENQMKLDFYFEEWCFVKID